MAEQDKNVNEEPTPIDPETAPEALQEAQSKTVRELRAEVPPESEQPEEIQAFHEAEGEEGRKVREEAEDALNKPIEAIEDAINEADRKDKQHQAHIGGVLAHTVPPTTTIAGRTFPYPIYTVIFGILGVITIVEILIAELLPREFFLTPILLIGLSIVKAVLVVQHYMHLKEDSKVFAIALLLPVFISLISVMFLLAVPTTGY